MSIACLLTANTSAYDSLAGLLDMLGTEFERLGHRVVTINLRDPAFGERLKEIIGHRAETFALSLSGLGLEIRAADRRLFWDAAQIPFFSWYCDHPSYFIRRHRIASPYIAHGYVFPDHAKFNRDYLKVNGAAFPVHMGIPDPGFFAEASGDRRKGGSRNGRIIFAKSGWDPNLLERHWRTTVPPRLFRLLFDIIDASSESGCVSFPQTIIDVAEQHSIYLSAGGDLFNALLTRTDNYIRATKTTLLASILTKHPVDFFGSGWDYMAPQATKSAFHGPIPFAALCKTLPAYLGAASINPNVDLSVHDRVFFSIGAGVTPIFDGNAFSRAHMPMLKAHSFSYHRESIEAAVDCLLSQPSEAQENVAAALAALYPAFSMRNAARQIHEICTSVGPSAAAASPAPPSPSGVWTPASGTPSPDTSVRVLIHTDDLIEARRH